MLLTKVIIDGITVEDSNGSPNPKKVISWEAPKEDEAITDCEIVLLKNVNDLVTLNNGKVVQIYAGTSTSTDRRYFYGYITNIKPSGSTIKILCKNEMINLVRRNVNKVYDSSIDPSAGEVSEIVEDLIETYGELTATVQPSGTADGQRVDEFKCINADVYERVLALKKALNWDLYYRDHTRVVFFEPYGFNSSGYTVNVGTEIIGLIDWDFDTDELINDLRVDGATVDTTITETGQIGVDSGYTTSGIILTKTPNSAELLIDASNPPTTQREGGSKDASSAAYFYIDRENKQIVPTSSFTTNHYAIVNYIWSAPAPIHMTNQSSIDTFGKHEKTIQLGDVTSVADAESRAANILAKRSIPFISGTMEIRTAFVPDRGETIIVNDTITPTVNGVTVSGEYVATSVTYKYPSATETVTVGDRPFRIDDWQQTTEERIRRLEEQFIRNQDIILELKDVQNDIRKLVPRYHYVFTQDYTVADNTMIWDNPTHGIWDTDNWATDANPDGFDDPVDHFLKQYENVYTEEFIDDDFKASATTATWSTGGSVTFTSGQVAQSTAIDYNNGTITTATLTATEVSGSFDYEMSADGGSNWESVTNGAAHTFSNTGTDLRWRATENAASTGEISEVVINGYH